MSDQTSPVPTTRARFSRIPRSRELLAAGLLIAAGLASFTAERWDRSRFDDGLKNENEFILGSERLLSALKDVESGQRGYLLTGDDAYLEPFNAAVPELRRELGRLAKLGLPMDGLSNMVEDRVAIASTGIQVRHTGGLDGAVAAINGGRGKQLMDAIRVRISTMNADAQRRIDKGERRVDRHSWVLTLLSLIALAGSVACVAAYAVRRRRESSASKRRTRESEARFRSLAENSAAIIWTTSAKGRFETEQPQWTAFTGQAEGANWADAIHPEDRDMTLRAWSKAVSARVPYIIDHRMRRADGEWRHMTVQAVPVLEDGGEIREWVGTHTDITERRYAEDALAAAKDAAEAANRSKSAFLANMSHELRTPLSAVIGYSEMLEEEIEELGQPHLLSDLTKIKTNARHLLSLINDVLDLSKIEANKMTSYAEDFDVGTLARDAAGTVDSLVQKKGNTLKLDLGLDLGIMHTDVVKLRQCIFNLVSNAAKFTEHGTIILSVRRDGDWVEFQVSDSGIGMTEEQVSRLFRRFEQADGSTTRNFGGSGLGLALTRAFCRLMGGDVSVQSRLGEGTTFTLRLPSTLPDQLVEAEAGAGPDATPSGKPVVLVVDDDVSQRELLTRFLEREGFAVRSASDGRTGLELARAIRPRAILLDVMMPQMDGWSVLTALKADAAVASIPVVMASFVNEPALANALGAADYVLKPVEWEHLKSVMARFRAVDGAVLVVDDDPDARSRLRNVLEREGWAVAEAANGEEALRSVAGATPQLILLDLTMPVMDGFTFLHALREQPGCGNIPVVVLSARDLSKVDRERLTGADRVIRKGDIDLRKLPQQLAELKHHPE